MAKKQSNISIQSILQKQQLENLNLTASAQLETLKSIESIALTDRMIQAAQVVEERKIQVDEDKSLEETKGINKNIKELGKTLKTAIDGFSKENAKIATSLALDVKTYKTIGEKIVGKIVDVKGKFSSTSRVLDTLGVVKRDSGGIISNVLQKREEKGKFVKEQQMMGSEKSVSQLKSDYTESQKLSKQIQKNEKEISKFRKMGLSEAQIEQTKIGKPLLETRQTLGEKYSKLDMRTQLESGEENNNTTTLESGEDNNNTTNEAELEQEKRDEKSQDLLEKIVENTTPIPLNEKKPAEAANDSIFKGGLLETLGIIGLMKSLKSIISGIFTGIGKALLGAFELLFKPSVIFKGLLKGFAIGTLIMSIVNGFIEGFKEYQKSGKIGEAIIAGLGGMIEFLTFGLISKEDYALYAKKFNAYVDTYIVEPIKVFLDDMGKLFNEWIADPIKNMFDKVSKFFSDAFESFKNIISGIGIPEIDISSFSKYIPGVPDKIGPWMPFADSATKESPKPVPKGINDVKPEVTPTTPGTKYIPYNKDTANVVNQKTTDVVSEKESLGSKGNGNTIVSAPNVTTNNQSVNKNIIRVPPTNPDRTYNKYIKYVAA